MYICNNTVHLYEGYDLIKLILYVQNQLKVCMKSRSHQKIFPSLTTFSSVNLDHFPCNCQRLAARKTASWLEV